MAGKGMCKKTLTCESVSKIIRKVEDDIKLYSEFLMDNAKVHEGILSDCFHREEYVNKVSELISKLEEVKELTKSHVHVIDEATLIRVNPGRRKKFTEQKPSPLLPVRSDTDSGVGSQDMKDKCMANSSSSKPSSGYTDIACSGYTDIACSGTQRNISSCPTYDDNRDQQENVKCRSKQLPKNQGLRVEKHAEHGEEDYNNVHEASQTHLKTSFDTNSDTVHTKDDPEMKKDDKRRSH